MVVPKLAKSFCYFDEGVDCCYFAGLIVLNRFCIVLKSSSLLVGSFYSFNSDFISTLASFFAGACRVANRFCIVLKSFYVN